MPFNVSHASAIIPLNKKPLVLSGLVVGSMSPDTLMYLPYIPDDQFTHTISGSFYFCWPASMLLLAFYHKFLKAPLILLMPLCIHR